MIYFLKAYANTKHEVLFFFFVVRGNSCSIITELLKWNKIQQLIELLANSKQTFGVSFCESDSYADTTGLSDGLGTK